MAFVWVQHYFPLPVIFEGAVGMGDDLRQGQIPSENYSGRGEYSFMPQGGHLASFLGQAFTSWCHEHLTFMNPNYHEDRLSHEVMR